MKKNLEIVLLVVYLSIGYDCRSQTEHGLLPYSNKLLLNPSFAGLDRSESVWSSLRFFAESAENINNSFTFTYDRWSEKLKAGTAWYFYQGLQGTINTTYTGAGYTFAKPVNLNQGKLIPSVNLNYWAYTKQWFVYAIDSRLDKTVESYRPPGKNFLLYNQFTPRLGLLWESPELSVGVSASYGHRHLITEPDIVPEFEPYHVVVHASQKMRGKQNGLESQPFKASPELVFLYSYNLLLSRAGFRMEQVGHLMSVFVQNNYTDNIHGVAGVFGWKNDILNVILTAGGAYSIQSKKASLFGEISFGMVIPYHFSNDINPWAPPDDPF